MSQNTAKPVCVLMATYNGASHVREQVASIQAQTVPDWRLLIRDDGSTDGTRDILAELARQDDRISLIYDGGEAPLGVVQNFSRLLQLGQNTACDVFFLSDQDDMWEPHKLARQLAEFPDAGCEPEPWLVHSDLTVVDEHLEPVHASLIRHMALESSPERPLNYLLTRNFVTGCATACNRRLLEEALPVPGAAIMHDWWLAVVAAATGSIRCVPEPLVRYRQHIGNTLGARGFWHGLNPTNNWIRGWQEGNREFLATFSQIHAVYCHSQSKAVWPVKQVEVLLHYSRLMSLPRAERVRAARSLHLRQGNLLLKLIYYLRLIGIAGARRSHAP